MSLETCACGEMQRGDGEPWGRRGHSTDSCFLDGKWLERAVWARPVREHLADAAAAARKAKEQIEALEQKVEELRGIGQGIMGERDELARQARRLRAAVIAQAAVLSLEEP